MKRTGIWLLAAGLLVTGTLSGCQRKFTRQRFETLCVGMPDVEVRNVLGKPAAKSPDRWTYLHKMPYYRAIIVFEDGKLIDKQWSVERDPNERR